MMHAARQVGLGDDRSWSETKACTEKAFFGFDAFAMFNCVAILILADNFYFRNEKTDNLQATAHIQDAPSSL
jgi:hypothetical protein